MTLKDTYHLVYKAATTPFFPACMLVRGFSGRLSNLTDRDIEPKKMVILVEDGVTHWFLDRATGKSAKLIFKDLLGDPESIPKIKEEEKRLSEALLSEICDESELFKDGTLSEEGAEHLKRLFGLIRDYGIVMDAPGFLFQLYISDDMQKEIEDLGLPEEKTQEILHHVFSSHKRTNYERFLFEVRDVIEGKRSKEDVARDFRWLTHDYLGDIIDEKYVAEKAEEFKEENLEEHLKSSDERIEKIESLVSELPEGIQARVRIVQEILYLYNEKKKETINQVNIFIRKVVEKRAGTERISELKKIYQMTPDEIVAFLQGESIPYEERDKRWCHEIFDERISNGSEEYFQLIEQRRGRSVLKGQPASKGKAKGKASIILNVSHMHKFTKGDILVAPFTNVSYLPIMRKAKAILTETGGTTSHAAVVSRELGIPCIVGIEGLLLKLQDGEQIEVDATEGIVRRIQ